MCIVSNCLTCQFGNSKKCQICASPYVVSNGQCVCGFQNCLDCSQSVLSCNSCPAPLIGTINTPNCVPEPSLSYACSVANC